LSDVSPPDLARLSLNQATTQRWTLREAVDGCARAGIPWIGPWRDKVAEAGGAVASAKLIRDAGLRVSSLCRGGFFPAATESARRERIDENRRALDEAAELGTDVLVLVCGPAPDRDIDAARRMVEEGIAAVIPYAAERGVRLAIEPLHPVFAGDRSVIVTLAQANALAERLDSPHVGVAVDVYHVWWDPEVYAQIARASGRILGFHISDWLAPPPDVLLGRGMMGDGVIQLQRLRLAVEAAGYTGPIEVEIFNQKIWDTPGDQVLATILERYRDC
jgi:sugar phosphate isomerase/epimerase